MRNIPRYTLTALFCLLAIAARAELRIQNEHLTTLDGLANNSVRYMMQDSKGFIWMSTLNGLSRYDGNTFVNFYPDASQGISLADPRINRISEDKNEHLWVTTFGNKVSCYDLRHGRFVDFTVNGQHDQTYSTVTIADNGDVWLWARSNNVRRVQYSDGKFTSEVFDVASGKLPSDNVNCLIDGINSSGESVVYIGTDKGLSQYKDNKMTAIDTADNFVAGHIFGDAATFIKSDGTVMLLDDTKSQIRQIGKIDGVKSFSDITGISAVANDIWLVLTPKGGFEINHKSTKVSNARSEWNIPKGIITNDNKGNLWIHDHSGCLVFIKADGSKTKMFTLMQPNEASVITTERYTIVEDDRGIVWISTYGNGLYQYSIETGELVHHRFNNANFNNIIPGNTIQSIMLDRDGGVWVSAEYSGISHLRISDNVADHIYPEDPNSIGVYVNDVRMIAPLNGGSQIAVSTRNGKVMVYDNKLSKIDKVYTYDKNVYDIMEDTHGNMWVATRGNGLRINGKEYMAQFGDENALSANELFCLLCDKKGRVWVGTFGGGLDLATLDTDGNPSFKHFLNESYGQRRIHALAEDADGYIWAATSDGIYIFNPDEIIKDNKQYYHYSTADNALASNEIKDIMIDRRGDVWIAESGTGFAVCTPTEYDKLEFKHYSVKDGLVNSMVQAFLDVSPKQVWITTEYGVSCFNPVDKTFSNYFFGNDMADNSYTQGSALKLGDGRIALGTRAGIKIINPDEIKTDSAYHQPVFTSLSVNGFNTETNDAEFDFSVTYAPAITLEYDQNSIKVDFSTLDFPINSSHIYSYYLEGYDKDWS